MRAHMTRSRLPLRVELLENRCVPTTATLTGGVLNVFGTSGVDDIHVSQANGAISVSGVAQSFSASQVKLISVEAMGSDDVVTVACESLDRFRTDQSGRASNDEGAHAA